MVEPAGPVEQHAIATPQGDARVHVRRAPGERLALLLQHGANGSIRAQDLLALATALPDDGVTTLLLQQPFAVAGKKVAPRPAMLDAALETIVPAVRSLLPDVPLVLGGRSSGARCACRQGGPLGAVGALALAFPLHPPGRPESSRAEELLGSTVPTLVVQGTRDPFGGPDEFPALPEHVEMVEVPGGDHGFRVLKAATPGQAETLTAIRSAVRTWVTAL